MNKETLNLFIKNIDNFLKLENKDFSFNCITLLRELKVNDEELRVLIDLDELKRTLGRNATYCFPILKEVIPDVSLSALILVNGYQRYYDRIFILNNKKYIISNDWYYKNKVVTNDNRTPFLKYVKSICNNRGY